MWTVSCFPVVVTDKTWLSSPLPPRCIWNSNWFLHAFFHVTKVFRTQKCPDSGSWIQYVVKYAQITNTFFSISEVLSEVQFYESNYKNWIISIYTHHTTSQIRNTFASQVCFVSSSLRKNLIEKKCPLWNIVEPIDIGFPRIVFLIILYNMLSTSRFYWSHVKVRRLQSTINLGKRLQIHS